MAHLVAHKPVFTKGKNISNEMTEVLLLFSHRFQFEASNMISMAV